MSSLAAPLQGFFRDLTSLTSVSGLNSGIYSALTASFVLAGLTYFGLPTQTLTAVFGTAAEKGLEDIFLWQLIGTAVSMAVAPIAFTQQVTPQLHVTNKKITMISDPSRKAPAACGSSPALSVKMALLLALALVLAPILPPALVLAPAVALATLLHF